jgi:hypothetical protein
MNNRIIALLVTTLWPLTGLHAGKPSAPVPNNKPVSSVNNTAPEATPISPENETLHHDVTPTSPEAPAPVPAHSPSVVSE